MSLASPLAPRRSPSLTRQAASTPSRPSSRTSLRAPSPSPYADGAADPGMAPPPPSSSPPSSSSPHASSSPRASSTPRTSSSSRSTPPPHTPPPATRLLSFFLRRRKSSHGISSAKHALRQQQAHLAKLEHRLSASVGAPPSALSSSQSSPPGALFPQPEEYAVLDDVLAPRMVRRASRDVLEELAGPESSLPLPTHARGTGSLSADGIREGQPMDFGPPSPGVYSVRTSSPTRTLSRIPVSSVGSARALAEESSSQDILAPPPSGSSTTGTFPPPSPLGSTSSGLTASTGSTSKRLSLAPGGTTKVLADLQAGAASARAKLEDTKQQLRMSQRQVATLTRQTEDVKDSRERLRVENDSLNQVVARKERLLQEAVARARKAEEERDALRATAKSEGGAAKRAVREAEAAAQEATAHSARREREYVTLRDSVAGLKDGFKADQAVLREEVKRREGAWRKEAEEVGRRYKRLVEQVKEKERAKESVRELRREEEGAREALEQEWRAEIRRMQEEVERSGREGREALQLAEELAQELARLRRLMQVAGRGTASSEDPVTAPAPS